MPLSQRNVSIGAALIFSVALIGVAYLLSSPYGALNRAGAQSSEEILRAYAKKDADNDGLYDWQESLYDTDPLNPESVQQGMTDAEAVAAGLVAPKYVSELPKPQTMSSEELDAMIGPAPAPGSLTEEFSREFLEAYFDANGAQVLDQGAQDVLVQELINDFTARASKQLGSSYTLTSVSQSASVTVTAYAANLERAVRDHNLTLETADPVTLMDAFLVQNDTSARAKIVTLGNVYAKIRQNLLSLSVPPALADEHLVLLRAYDTLTVAMEVTARYEEDPLAVMGVLGVYPSAAQGILDAGAAVGKALIAESGVPKDGEPGSMFVNVLYVMESL